MIVLDANVLIAFLDGDDAHHGAAIELLERHSGEGIASSVLTVAEALVHPTRANRQHAVLGALGDIGLRVLPLDETDALALADIRHRSGLRMPDAAALHCAITRTSRLATFDDRLAAAARSVGVAVVGPFA